MVWNSTNVADIFNFTLSPTPKAPYNLTADNGGLFLDRELVAFNANMDSCSSLESNEYRINPASIPPSGIPEGDWTYPSVNLNFDSRTANITVDGYFLETSYLWANITGGKPTLGPTTGCHSMVLLIPTIQIYWSTTAPHQIGSELSDLGIIP